MLKNYYYGIRSIVRRRILLVYLRQLLWWLGLLLLLPSVLMYVDEHWIIKVLSNAPSVESISPFVDGNDLLYA